MTDAPEEQSVSGAMVLLTIAGLVAIGASAYIVHDLHTPHRSSLSAAIEDNDAADTARWLRHDPDALNRPMPEEHNALPLMRAIGRRRPHVVRVLLDRRAELDTTNPATGARELAIHVAAELSTPDIVRMLIEAGADPDARSIDGDRPMHVACRKSGSFYRPWTFVGLEEASKNAEREIGVVAALLDAGADLEATDDAGRTPLHRAVQFGCPQVAEYLIGRGADVNAPARDIIAARTDPAADPTASHASLTDGTLLHWAVLAKPHPSGITWLLDHGARPDAVADYRPTPDATPVPVTPIELARLIDNRPAADALARPAAPSVAPAPRLPD